MRFTAAATLAFVASVFAQTADFDALTTPLKGEQVPAGQTYTVKWLPGKYTTGTATLSLLGGADDKTLLDLGSIGQADNGAGEFAWTVAANLGDKATYGIKITLDSDPSIFQYSFPFAIAGGSKAESSSSGGYPVSSISSSSSYPTTSAIPASSFPASSAYTISLTTASSNATASSAVASSTYTASSFPTLTPSSNASTSATRAPTSFTSLTSARTSSAAATASSTSSSPSSVPTGAAPRVSAGSIALLSGLAAAVFAL